MYKLNHMNSGKALLSLYFFGRQTHCVLRPCYGTNVSFTPCHGNTVRIGIIDSEPAASLHHCYHSVSKRQRPLVLSLVALSAAGGRCMGTSWQKLSASDEPSVKNRRHSSTWITFYGQAFSNAALNNCPRLLLCFPSFT